MRIVSKEIRKIIDRTIKQIWTEDISKDYENFNMLLEDSLKCCFYYHIRKKLETILNEYNLHIYTEYHIKELGYKADIAIVQILDDCAGKHLRDCVCDVISVFELKYVCKGTAQNERIIESDIYKIKDYVKTLDFNCRYYFCVIYEVECDKLSWFKTQSINNWASNRVTELVAGYIKEKMKFEVHSYNKLNKDI